MKNAWHHPEDPNLFIHPRVAAAMTLISMGFDDLKIVGRSTGLSADDMSDLDAATDPMIRRLAIIGIPAGHFFPLKSPVVCPMCSQRISVVPCVSCSAEENRRQRRVLESDALPN